MVCCVAFSSYFIYFLQSWLFQCETAWCLILISWLKQPVVVMFGWAGLPVCISGIEGVCVCCVTWDVSCNIFWDSGTRRLPSSLDLQPQWYSPYRKTDCASSRVWLWNCKLSRSTEGQGWLATLSQLIIILLSDGWLGQLVNRVFIIADLVSRRNCEPLEFFQQCCIE